MAILVASATYSPYMNLRLLLIGNVKLWQFHIRLAEQITTDNEKDAEKFYKQSLNAGNEGVMFKSLKAPYKPGSRVGYMLKHMALVHFPRA